MTGGCVGGYSHPMNNATSPRPAHRLCTRTQHNAFGDTGICTLPRGHYGDCDAILTTWLCRLHTDCRAVNRSSAARNPWLLEDNNRPHHADCPL